MTEIHCFTSISFAYLDRARVLAETVKRFHPDWTLWLCLSDREPPNYRFDLEQEDYDRLVRIEDLGIEDLGIENLDSWIYQHDVVELCTAVKGAMMDYMMEKGAEKVVYIDPDIALFGSLADIGTLLDRHSIVLTPHLVAPEKTVYGILDNEIGSLKHGTFNLGFVAAKNDTEGRRFAQWWRDRLRDYCFDDIPAGLFTDQRWCDLAPSFFDGVHILRDPGYNVACWNLSNREIEIDHEGKITAAKKPLRFFHFTKVNSVGEAVIERYCGGHYEVFELLRWYRERLAANKVQGVESGWWAFGKYEDGTPITHEDRLAYRQRPDLHQHFSKPFASGQDSFQDWLQQR